MGNNAETMPVNRNPLFAQGEWLLSHPNLLEPCLERGWSQVLRLWEDIANPFGEIRTTSWSVFRFTWPDEETQPWLREVVWDRRAELSRLGESHAPADFDQVPSLSVRDCLFTRSSLASIEEWAARLTVSVGCRSDAVSSHATHYGFEIKFFAGSTQLEWTDDIPPEWLEIVKKAQQLRNYFRKSLDYCNPEMSRMNE